MSGTDGLYKAFAKYKHPTKLEGCPCCTSVAEASRILSVPLREVPADRLEKYACKATTTWGTLDDYRHFLPRILELSRSGAMLCDLEVTLGKFGLNDFSSWPKSEQEAVTTFLSEWFDDALQALDFDLIDSIICGVARFADVGPFLDAADRYDPGMAEAYRNSSASMVKRKLTNSFWDRDTPNYQAVLRWAYGDK